MVASLDSAVEACRRAYCDAYDKEPEWLVRAPGRVNLIGEHVDYNGGVVLPMAIEREVWIAAGIGFDGFRFNSTAADAPEVRFHDPKEDTVKWGRYVRGVVAHFRVARAGAKIPDLNAMVHSTVPLGGGLSSSAALEVACATLLEAVSGHTLEPWEKVSLCQRAEREFAGVPCGFMDQAASVFGGVNELVLLDCQSREVQRIPVGDDVGFLVINSNVSHDLSDGGYAARRRQCEAAAEAMGVASLREANLELLARHENVMPAINHKRARHVLTEHERTQAAVDAIRNGDWRAAGEQLYAAHASIRDDFEVSTPELDLLVDLARDVGPDCGAYGARMTGGGFGGSTVTLVRSGYGPSVGAALASRYAEQVGIEPSWIWTRPAVGASVESL